MLVCQSDVALVCRTGIMLLYSASRLSPIQSVCQPFNMPRVCQSTSSLSNCILSCQCTTTNLTNLPDCQSVCYHLVGLTNTSLPIWQHCILSICQPTDCPACQFASLPICQSVSLSNLSTESTNLPATRLAECKSAKVCQSANLPGLPIRQPVKFVDMRIDRSAIM
jgi:hypothetical protein